MGACPRRRTPERLSWLVKGGSLAEDRRRLQTALITGGGAGLSPAPGTLPNLVKSRHPGQVRQWHGACSGSSPDQTESRPVRQWTLLTALLLGPLGCGIAEVGESEEVEEGGWEENSDADHGREPLGACHSQAVPAERVFSRGPEGYADYVGQSHCDPDAKPGVLAFSKLVLATYPCTRSGGIVRACSVGGRSEHKEGRAWDWMVAAGSTAAATLIHWLLADRGGNDSMARRLGIMYMVFDRRIWKSYEADRGWQHYSGSNPHTDHIHFSFSWAGARKQTSFWDGELNRDPNGWLQRAHCEEGIVGWARDRNDPKQAARVELQIGDRQWVVTADRYRAELCDKLGSCRHGFEAPVPPIFRDGKTHRVRAFGIDTTNHSREELNGSPREFTCPAN